MPGEHVVVEHQGVPATEQLGQTHHRRCAVRADAVEPIVLWYFAARRQRPQFSCDGLHFPSQPYLALQQRSTRPPVVRRFVRKSHIHGPLFGFSSLPPCRTGRADFDVTQRGGMRTRPPLARGARSRVTWTAELGVSSRGEMLRVQSIRPRPTHLWREHQGFSRVAIDVERRTQFFQRSSRSRGGVGAQKALNLRLASRARSSSRPVGWEPRIGEAVAPQASSPNVRFSDLQWTSRARIDQSAKLTPSKI